MNALATRDPVIEELEDVLDRGDLPPPYDRWGARLLAHLTKPVQVVVTGFAGSGKTALLEMMTAQPVLGRDRSFPMVELVYGPSERAIIERVDGSVTSQMGYLRDAVCPEDAVRVRQELPDPAMMLQDYIEIGLHGSFEHKRRTLQRAVARADVVIWCSERFDEEERALWSMVPDPMKDHSVLALTKADQQMMRGVLTDRIAELEPVVAMDFLGLFPVATIQGLTARTSSDEVNEVLWSSSGGQHLVELIAKQVHQGRKADVDQARVFMERLAKRSARKAAEPVLRLEVNSDLPELMDADPAGVVEVDAEVTAAFERAASLLQSHAREMFDKMEKEGALDPETILIGCSEAMAAVTDVLQSAGPDSDVADAVRDDVQEGEEMLMLFQLEQGEDAALDAVTLLMQVRKELVDKMAG